MRNKNRREFLALSGTAAATFAVGAVATSPALVNPLATEGRRLVRAYFATYAAWYREAAVADSAFERGEPYAVVRPLEERGDKACAVAARASEAMLGFVVRASGRETLSGRSDCIEMDQWPALAVELDGVLWIAMQNPDGDAGDMLLTHTVVADVVRLTEGGGR